MFELFIYSNYVLSAVSIPLFRYLMEVDNTCIEKEGISLFLRISKNFYIDGSIDRPSNSNGSLPRGSLPTLGDVSKQDFCSYVFHRLNLNL